MAVPHLLLTLVPDPELVCAEAPAEGWSRELYKPREVDSQLHFLCESASQLLQPRCSNNKSRPGIGRYDKYRQMPFSLTYNSGVVEP